MKNKKLFIIIELAVIAGAVIFDQLTKIAAASILPGMGGTYDVFPGFAAFTYVENTGAAFSMFSGSTLVLGIISVALAAVLVYIMLKGNKYRSMLLSLSLSFLIGGAIGNAIDRLALGYVRDMIEFTFVDFAVFNVADSFACIGAVMLGVFLLFFWDKAKKKLGEAHS